MAGAGLWILMAGLFVAVGYLTQASGVVSLLRSALKTLPLALFALAAWLADASPYLIMALSLSAAGDLALSRAGRAAFLYGLAVFALAHLFYATVFLAISGLPIWDAFSVAPLAGVGMLALALSTELWLTPHADGLRWPVRGYVAIITVMMIAGLTLWDSAAMVVVGAGLIVLSDLILGLRRFRMNAAERRAQLAHCAVWVSYIVGQALIVWGLVAL